MNEVVLKLKPEGVWKEFHNGDIWGDCYQTED